MKPFRLALLTGVVILASGCFTKKPRVIVPMPLSLPPAAPTPPPVIPPPDTTDTPATTIPAPTTQIPKTTLPPAVRPRPAAPAAAGTPAPVVAPPPVINPAPTPTLGAILTGDQKKQLDEAYRSDVQQANTLLKELNGHALTHDQADSVSRAREFIRQAAQYHNRDLTTAAELARRARVLIQDLAGALR